MTTTATHPDSPEHTPLSLELGSSVSSTVERLQSRVSADASDTAASSTRAVLARLRRSAGRSPEQDPLGFQEALSVLSPPLKEDDYGRGGFATGTERAAFHALTMFALHSQSLKSPAHIRGRSFGTAVGQLIKNSSSQSIKPRFDALLAARSEAARLTHARSIVALLRTAEIGFDYGMFARDLRTLSSRKRASVLLRWGRDVVLASTRSTSQRSS